MGLWGDLFWFGFFGDFLCSCFYFVGFFVCGLCFSFLAFLGFLFGSLFWGFCCWDLLYFRGFFCCFVADSPVQLL